MKADTALTRHLARAKEAQEAGKPFLWMGVDWASGPDRTVEWVHPPRHPSTNIGE